MRNTSVARGTLWKPAWMLALSMQLFKLNTAVNSGEGIPNGDKDLRCKSGHWKSVTAPPEGGRLGGPPLCNLGRTLCTPSTCAIAPSFGVRLLRRL